MDLSTSVLGSTAAARLQELHSEHILIVGKDKLTRAQLARAECFNYVAAKNLSRALRELDVTSLKQLYDRVPPSALALPRIGVVSLAVLGAAFEAKGIGGSAPLENWVKSHQEHITTFYTIKRHEEEDVARERKEKRARKRRHTQPIEASVPTSA